MTPLTLIEVIAHRIAQRHSCLKAGNPEWLDRSTADLETIELEYLPSGSGIDSGTSIDLDASTANRVVFDTSFHHVNDGGYYDGWTEHRIIVQPSFIGGLTVTVTGRDRNGIKEYLRGTFDHCLSQVAPYHFQPSYITPEQCQGDN